MPLDGIDIRSDGSALVVAPTGDVDLTNADDLRAAILAALSNERESVIVDFSGTRYLDSAGIRVLFSIARRLEERRRRLAIVAPRGAQIRKILSLVDIQSRATVHETVESARKQVESG